MFVKFDDYSGTEIIIHALQPVSPSDLSVGTTMQFFAYGTYSDNAVTNITPHVTWNSDNSSVAYINVNRLVKGEAAGQANITASLDGITSPAVSLPVIISAATPISTTPGPHVNWYRNNTTVNTFD